VGTDRLVDAVAEAGGVAAAVLPAAGYCERANALIASLAHRIQGDSVREDSVPYCARRGR
jgi:hypothetical protein